MPRNPSQLSHILRKQPQLLHRRGPSTYPPPQHHEDIKGTGKENQKPADLGEWLEQKE